MSLFVDTNVWSLAFRRDSPPDIQELECLRDSLSRGETVCTPGLELQELLQGCRGPQAGRSITDLFANLVTIMPSRDDHVDAARLRNVCRRRGIQVGTRDALLAQLCIRHRLVMLSTDRDFASVADFTPLRLWRII